MLVVHVFVKVKPECIDDFIVATLKNAKASQKEAGIARFDVLQEKDNPEHFLLVEVYRTQEDTNRHKETAHYERWRDDVEDMISVPRTKKIYKNLFPDERGWD